MNVVVVSGSVFGNAQAVAEHAVSLLSPLGFELVYLATPTLDAVLAQQPQALLVVTSTTGMGELPANIQGLYYEMRERFPAWAGMPAGVIGLGDSNYGDTFCAAAEQMCELLAELGLVELQPMLRLDASETVNPEKDAEPWLLAFAQALKSA